MAVVSGSIKLFNSSFFFFVLFFDSGFFEIFLIR